MINSTNDVKVSSGRYLYAFDFDHTILAENSDVAILSVLDHPLPKDIKRLYDGLNWTNYMNAIFTHIKSQGIPVARIEEKIKTLTFVPGMENLLKRIASTKNLTGSQWIIMSDANEFFIKWAIDGLSLPSSPDLIITNEAVVEDDHLTISPYEFQTDCKICPKNLCKGKALELYLKESGPFEAIYYCGDGENDLCPGEKLSDRDTLFVRKDYRLDKAIKKGNLNKHPVEVKAKILTFEDGDFIESNMKF